MGWSFADMLTDRDFDDFFFSPRSSSKPREEAADRNFGWLSGRLAAGFVVSDTADQC